MSVYLEKVKEPMDIPEALKSIIGTDEIEAYRFFDSSVYDEGKGYNVYKLVTADRAFVLKKYASSEDRDAEILHYSLLKGLPVPELLATADDCILLSFVEGEDLKNTTDEGVSAAAESLAAVMNAYPMGREYDRSRYDTYLRRLERRAKCLKDEPGLAAAFGRFYERQKEIPLTLSNADLLPINFIYNGGKAVIIDWEFGGFMPYALDIARFFTHCTPDGSVTSFRMTDEQKKLFADTVYDRLEVKPDRAVYDRDVLLASYNECIEILEYYLNDPSAERGSVFELYYPMAHRLARLISGV